MQLPVTFEMNRGRVSSDIVAIARTAVGVATFKRNEEVLLPGARKQVADPYQP